MSDTTVTLAPEALAALAETVRTLEAVRQLLALNAETLQAILAQAIEINFQPVRN